MYVGFKVCAKCAEGMSHKQIFHHIQAICYLFSGNVICRWREKLLWILNVLFNYSAVLHMQIPRHISPVEPVNNFKIYMKKYVSFDGLPLPLPHTHTLNYIDRLKIKRSAFFSIRHGNSCHISYTSRFVIFDTHFPLSLAPKCFKSALHHTQFYIRAHYQFRLLLIVSLPVCTIIW